MKSDIEIARSIELTKIKQIAREYGIPVEEISNYGRYIAKVPETLIDEEKVKKSNLILVTAITPTKAGIGVTTRIYRSVLTEQNRKESLLCLARTITVALPVWVSCEVAECFRWTKSTCTLQVTSTPSLRPTT